MTTTDLQHQKERTNTARQEIIDTAFARLAGGFVEIELPPTDQHIALDTALRAYKQQATNAFDEGYTMLTLQQDTTEYILPDEVVDVMKIYRGGFSRSYGTNTTNIDPFNINFFNTYLLNPMVVGSLTIYELYYEKLELMKRMFKGYINFTWHRHSHTLKIVENPRAHGEVVLLHVYYEKPEEALLTDYQTRPWIEDYTIMTMKEMLGQGRGKFQSLGGPQGGISLNAADLLSQAQQERERLIQDIKDFVDGSRPYGFIIG